MLSPREEGGGVGSLIVRSVLRVGILIVRDVLRVAISIL